MKKQPVDAEHLISSYGRYSPAINSRAFVDLSARIIGNVVIDEGASVWPMSVLRADAERISLGRRSAVLDLCLVEAPEGNPVIIEEDSLISHGATIHGAHVGPGVLVGIRAVVLDGATVGPGSIIGAASLVTAGTVIPPNSLAMGTPARILRQTTQEERTGILRQIEELAAKAALYGAAQKSGF